MAHQLTRPGYLVTEPCEAEPGAYVVAFVSRLHMEYTRYCFYHCSYSVLPQMPTSISDFLTLVVQQMSSGWMASAMNVSSAASQGLSEARYHNEFYRYSCCKAYTTPPQLHGCAVMQGMCVYAASWSLPFSTCKLSIWCTGLHANACKVGV